MSPVRSHLAARHALLAAATLLACSSRDVSLGDDAPVAGSAQPSPRPPPAPPPAEPTNPPTDLDLDVEPPLPEPLPPTRCGPEELGTCLPLGAKCWGNLYQGQVSSCAADAVCCVSNVSTPPGGSTSISPDPGGYGGE
ncbi:MAG: hypothetical protein EOO73_28005 [Myxococcales bacterium]|nr:MAG: hypothetical protein EOO73_28005 [Myxococcales bacterium]